MCSKMAAVPAGDLPHVSQDKDDGYMVTIQVPGRRLGLDGLSTVGAGWGVACPEASWSGHASA